MHKSVRDVCTKWPFDELAWWCITIFQSALAFYCASIHHYYIIGSIHKRFMSICSKSRAISSCSNSASDGSNRLNIYVVACAMFWPIESFFCTLVELLYFNIWIIKDLCMMYRILCDGRHNGATGINKCTGPVVPSALKYRIDPWVRLIKQCRLRHH